MPPKRFMAFVVMYARKGLIEYFDERRIAPVWRLPTQGERITYFGQIEC